MVKGFPHYKRIRLKTLRVMGNHGRLVTLRDVPAWKSIKSGLVGLYPLTVTRILYKQHPEERVKK
jgi:hypothetical protein